MQSLLISKLENPMSSHKSFWDVWKELDENKNMSNFSDDMDDYQWENHYKTLFSEHEGNVDSILAKLDLPYNLDINRDFCMGDLQRTIRILNNGKAVGPDSIPNEFLIHAITELLGLILRFINLNISNGLTSSYWCLDLISQIHKGGPKKDPDNHRGICLMNALLKILCTMLNARLFQSFIKRRFSFTTFCA